MDDTMMTKQEALDLLGIASRSLHKHVESGKIRVMYVDSRYGKQALYPREDILKLQANREQRALFTRGATTPGTSDPVSPALTSAPLPRPSSRDPLPVTSDPLAQLVSSAIDTSIVEETFRQAARYYESGARNNELQALKAKTVLSLEEAVTVSGIALSSLMRMVKAGELKAKRIGRRWFTTHKALDALVGNV